MLTLLDHRGGRSCDGMSRRDFVEAGTLALGGLTLPWLAGTCTPTSTIPASLPAWRCLVGRWTAR